MIATFRSVALALALAAALSLAAAPRAEALNVGSTACGVVGIFSGGLGKVCSAATHIGRVIDAGKKLLGGDVGGALSALTSGPAKKLAGAALGLVTITAAAVAGARFALSETARVVGETTRPNLTSTWFSSSYWRMAAVSALLTLPFLFAAAVQAMVRSDMAMLWRAAFGYLPLGMLAVGVAAPLTMLMLAGSDELSAIVSSASAGAGARFLGRAAAALGVTSGATHSPFVAFFAALLTAAATIVLWLELLLREAAIYVIVLMLPLFFAALVWPARRLWAIRAVELLVALILSKFAIVSVLALGGAALGSGGWTGPGAMLIGLTLVTLAAFSPWALLRLLPLHEVASAAIGGLRGHAQHELGLASKPAAATAAGAAEHAALLPARLRDLAADDGWRALAPDGSSGALGPAVAREVEAAGESGAAGEAGREVAAGMAAGGAIGEEAGGTGDAGAPADVGGAARRAATDERGPLPGVFAAPDRSWRLLVLGAEDFQSERPLLDPEPRGVGPRPGPIDPDPGSAPGSDGEPG